MNTLLSNLGARVDLQLRQGADFSSALTFTNPDGTALDLTGVTMSAQVKRLPLDDEDAALFTIAIGAPTAGTADLRLSASATAAIPCGNSILDDASRYYWALKFVDAAGRVSTPLYGDVRVAPGAA